MQRMLSLQDTSSRLADALPWGEGTFSSTQWVPFQCSARAEPTAVHAFAAVQETLVSWANVPVGLGVAWIDQLLPFHTSARVAKLGLVVEPPTASHALADVQETPLSPLLFAPLGFWVGWMDQLLPFHTSASVCVVELGVAWPTASHELADVHEMLLSSPPPGSGMVTTVQVLPLRTSDRRVLLFVRPTATQVPVDVQDTAPKLQIDAPCGMAVFCGCQ